MSFKNVKDSKTTTFSSSATELLVLNTAATDTIQYSFCQLTNIANARKREKNLIP